MTNKTKTISGRDFSPFNGLVLDGTLFVSSARGIFKCTFDGGTFKESTFVRATKVEADKYETAFAEWRARNPEPTFEGEC